VRIGIDIGGTNTDAVIVDRHERVVAVAKRPTTDDPLTGISDALTTVLSQVDASAVQRAMLGTTELANALLERRGLDPVALVRIGAPATLGIPPAALWPDDLRARALADYCIVAGGFEFDGTPIAPLDEDAVRRFASSIAERAAAFAISSVFGSSYPEHALRAAELVRECAGEQVSVTIAHEIGTVGLIERENAAILNASLLSSAERVIGGLQRALADCGLSAEAFLSQNDGTLMGASQAAAFPILTVGSGPTNSIRGAWHLSGVADALVVDVGGTSTDIGMLAGGFPRESARAVEIGGVRTNFRMPDLISIALGGGSIVARQDGELHLGPDSVGWRLAREALCFGGSTTTLTDIGVAGGRLELGTLDPGALGSELVASALTQLDATLLENCERMKSSHEPLPLVAVGGASELVPERLPGVSEVIRAPHHEVANAIGAAIAEASGSFDQIVSYQHRPRADVVSEARELAVGEAVRAGAARDAVRIVSVTEIPVTYMPGGGCRLQVKAAGPLAPQP
jgi:N-methylhydantoinase A/oxoprolinase/acetone carboxylase beta subunit